MKPCDHCGMGSFSTYDHIVWCRACIALDYKLLEQAGIYLSPSYKLFSICMGWSMPNNVAALKTIPKQQRRQCIRTSPAQAHLSAHTGDIFCRICNPPLETDSYMQPTPKSWAVVSDLVEDIINPVVATNTQPSLCKKLYYGIKRCNCGKCS